MADLDVALKLRLVNLLSGPAGAAKRDLASLKAAAMGLRGATGPDKLTESLKRGATAAQGTSRGLDQVKREARGLATTRGPGALAAGLRKVKADADAAAAALARTKRASAAAAAGLPRRDGRGRFSRDGAGAGGGAAEGESPSSIVALGKRAALAAGGLYALRAATRATVGEAISFEKAWADVIKKVDAPNAEAMERLQRTVKRVAVEVGIMPGQVAALTAEAGASGIAFQELERFVRLAAKASGGWDMAPQEASERLAKIKADGNLTIAEMEVLSDKINALGDNSAAKEREIVEMFLRAGSAAKAAGLSMDGTLAMLTALRSAGMNEEVAARFLTAFTGKLATAGAGGRGGKDMAEGFKILGLTTAQVAKGMKRDAEGTILDILERIQGASESAKAALKIAGGEWWDELLKMAGANPEMKKQLAFIRQPVSFKGSLDKNMAVQLATTANHLERLKALASDVGDRMGRWALPPINKGIEAVIATVDDLEKRAGYLERKVAEAEAAAPYRSRASSRRPRTIASRPSRRTWPRA